MVDPTAFAQARIPQTDTSLAQGIIRAELIGKEEANQEQIKQLATQAFNAWKSGDREAFSTSLGQLATKDQKTALQLNSAFGSLDRTNFVEAAYHIYNAARLKDPEAQNRSLLRAKDTLDVRPDHPFIPDIDETIALPPGDKKTENILTMYNLSRLWGAYGNPEGEYSGEKLDIARGNLAARYAELGLNQQKARFSQEQTLYEKKFGKLSEDFRRKPGDPTQAVSIPGTKEHFKRQETKTRLMRNYRDAVFKGERLIGQISQAINDTGIWTAGLIGHFAKHIPGSNARDLRSIIKTIEANIGFDRLREMRLNSPTGGALGQIAVKELDDLKDSLADLSQSQSIPQLRSNLGLVLKNYERVVNSAREYQTKLSGTSVDDLYSLQTSETPTKSETTSDESKSPFTADELDNMSTDDLIRMLGE